MHAGTNELDGRAGSAVMILALAGAVAAALYADAGLVGSIVIGAAVAAVVAVLGIFVVSGLNRA
jgi:hypothetical protein